MRQDWGMNGYGGDARFQQYGRDEDRSSRSRDMERGRGWSRDDDQREHGYGMRDRDWGMRDRDRDREWGMRDRDRDWGMRDRDEWRSGNGRPSHRSDDETRLSRGEAPIVKVIEVVAQSPHSWEDATRRAVAEASRTIDDIKSIYVKDMQAIVSNGRIVEFRLVAKVSFAIHGSRSSGRSQHA